MLQRGSRWLEVVLCQAQVLEHGIKHPPSTRVNAVVVKGLLEVRNVRRLLSSRLGLSSHELVPHVLDLLGEGQRDGSEHLNVLLQRLSGYLHQGLVELHSGVSFVVLLLKDALVGLVLRPDVRSHRVEELVLGLLAVLPLVRDQDRGPSDFEQVVWNGHRPVCALVVVLRDVFSAHDQCPAVWVALHELVHEGDADQSRAAAHPS
mmetsp:Transcript_4821/g.8530  ORF Transcript_4821/g.8530 Transcript_4821/m.8530 type:complete len:205 (-) Transcript_4821:614-1228(-)